MAIIIMVQNERVFVLFDVVVAVVLFWDKILPCQLELTVAEVDFVERLLPVFCFLALSSQVYTIIPKKQSVPYAGISSF